MVVEQLQLEQWPIERLVEYARNPRKNDHAVEKFAAAIREYGFRVPILAKSDGLVVDGHLRLKAARKLGLATVPVILADDMTDNQVRAFRLSVNKMADLAEWDEAMLALELSALQLEGFELDLTGFDPGEIEVLLDGEELPGNDGGGGEDTEPQIDRAEELRVKWGVETGQLWLLGEHRLLCGDSTKAEDVARVMGGEKAELCFTSPPYGQQRDYRDGATAQISDWDALMRGVFGNLPMAEAGQVLVNLGLIHRDGEWLPYWEGWIEWMRAQGWRRFGWYVWDQGSGLPGDWNGRFAPSFEFVFHFNKDAVSATKTKETKGGKCGTTMRKKDGKTQRFTTPAADVQPLKVSDSVIRVQRQIGSDGHPAQFPVDLPAEIIAAWPGTVYEPFSGSGTTIIAGENLGRKVRAIEISPAYVAVALERWHQHTGRDPVRAPDA